MSASPAAITPGTDENVMRVDEQFYPYLEEVGVPTNIHIHSFPDFLLPGSLPDVPEITAEQASQLSHFVRKGNGLVWFAGDSVKAGPWNERAASGDGALKGLGLAALHL